MDDLFDVSAMTLARRIRSRELSPVEVVQAHIERIGEVNGSINAVIAQRFDRALDEAKAAEERVMKAESPDELPLLLGLPYTAKEYIRAEGMPLSAGIWSRRNERSDHDAETIRRLRDAGAILVGITNVPEGGLWMETYNAIHGWTVNPWDPKRSAGGSSGGEGAIVATGGVAFGLGADVGGSIRIPAAFCGTVGHKPTGRLVPNTGFWPPTEGLEVSAYLVCGPLCRHVEDLMPILRTLAGPDGVDTVVRPWELEAPESISLRDVTVYPVETNGWTRIHPDCRSAIQSATEALKQRGAQIGRLDAPRMKKAFSIWSAMMSRGGGPSYSEIIGNGTAIEPVREMVRLALGRSRHTFPALAIIGLERIAERFPGQVDKAVSEGHALRAELEGLLGPRGVLIHPPYSRPAPRHRTPMLTPFDFVCTGLFNVLEFPSTVVPVGFSDQGVPLSVQVIGKRGADGLTISVASVLEQELGGWTRANPTWRLPEPMAAGARAGRFGGLGKVRRSPPP